ncbi:MAG: DUF2461 family protein [Acidimicrobiales bacterium]
MVFTGWPPEAFAFYRGLEADNTRTWWLAHKATFDAAVRGPSAAALDMIVDALRGVGPRRDWLDEYVGPSTLRPDG